MHIVSAFFDFFIHLDTHLGNIILSCGAWTYLVLFSIIFAETGLVVIPFLPGDSLLFACGAFAAKGAFNVWWLFGALAVAAIVGDSVNYAVGKYIGARMTRFLKKEHLDRTHHFFEKYGGKTIIFARFVPIVRTFAPFVAGLGKMSYGYFFTYNVVGGILWVALFVFGGYFFGNAPVVKEHFTIVIFAIIFVSVLPAIIEVLRHRKR